MYAALLCRVDPKRDVDRLRLRAEHLAYIVAHQERIVAGGPTLDPEGAPETMILLVSVGDLADAEAFIRSEPYTKHGVFDHVDIRAWVRVMPELQAGSLQAALDAELAKHRGSAS
jgi:uncharacterized protein YciI